MAQNSGIEWTEATWNPVTGCTRASRGCDHCYAVTMSKRLAAMGQEKYQGLVNPGKDHFNGVIKIHPYTLDAPRQRKKPTLYFVNSMSDLFHREVPVDFIQQVFDVMAETEDRHTYQILTKRPARMAEVMQTLVLPSGRRFSGAPLPNVWLGTSVEDQAAADTRIPHLLDTPAAIRFLSCEPLLDELDLSIYLNRFAAEGTGIHWVIVGGESGPGARPMKHHWVTDIRDQCEAANVDFFFKQWGGVNKKKNGRVLEGDTYDAMPEPVAVA
jgi:protein gp37